MRASPSGVRCLPCDLRTEVPQATECPGKDRQALLAFYDFPAEYRAHLEVITEIVFQDGVAVPKKGRQEVAA